ncbi:DUF4132 domain-containing protein [Deinococcus arcticus]|uniref:DUF4132 domain-containing protein n=1 Tax=Deinococcus arcticus TaxID=2136176 RepID=A0A2T3W8Y1_9DEIO|nr:DUF4132 domain-containing protein [Deinococcus arcticus]PTA68342.1 hypothetical protein C8263_07825 [Deinococcus arcticus]
MDVQEYLRGFQQPWKADFLARLSALPGTLADGLRADVAGQGSREERQQREAALTEYLHTSGPAERLALCAVFFPRFPEVAARTLGALLTRHPYPQGYARRAFRAPGDRRTAEHAQSWLWQTWHLTREYGQDLEWLTVHAGLLNPWQSQTLGLLLGQAVSDGDEAVFELLRQTAGAQHPVARMGRHVPLALLSSTREDAWTLTEGLLLGAQRQEGLRQVILETVDEASLGAFTRMLRLILNEDLLRFAATLRAACVWFGLNYDVTDLKAVRGHLSAALDFLDDPALARAAVTGGSGVAAYLALYTLAMADAQGAAALARPLLSDPDPERRMAAAQLLEAAGEMGAADLRLLLADPDLRLSALAGGRPHAYAQDLPEGTPAFEPFVAYAGRLPAQARHEPLLFPWLGHVPARSEAMDSLPGLVGVAPLAILAPYLSAMSSSGRSAALWHLRRRHTPQSDAPATPPQPLDAPTRALLLTLLQDRVGGVAQAAVEVMAHLSPAPEEVPILEGLLRRRGADLRRGLIRLLATDRAPGAQSALRLLAQSSTEQRQAGLQLLREVGAPPPADFKPKNVTEQTLLAVLTEPESQLSLRDGLGLFDPAALTRAEPPVPVQRDFAPDVARGADLLRALDALIEAHRETPLTGVGWDGEQTALLGNVSGHRLRARGEQAMPLADLWAGWWAARPGAQDGDLTRMAWALSHFVARQDSSLGDLEAELAELLGEGDEGETDADFEALTDLTGEEVAEAETERAQARSAAETKQALRRATLHWTLGPLVPLRLAHMERVQAVAGHLQATFSTPTDLDLALDAWATALSRLPQDARTIVDPQYVWRTEDPRDLLWPLRPQGRLAMTPAQARRFWQLTLHEGAAFPHLPRRRPDTALLLRAYEQGWAAQADLLDQLIGPRPERSGYYYGNDFDDLRTFTQRRLREDTPTHPDWMQAVETVRARVLEIESVRGDLETPATSAALSLQSVTGAALTLRLLAALGKNPLKRGYQGRNESRDVTFSHLIRVAFPAPGDTPAAFARLAQEAGVGEARLLDLAMFAPQWAPLVAGALGWRGLQDGVYWLHAHTRDTNWTVPQEIREDWEVQISERTALSPGDLMAGAVDVAWFHRLHRLLGKARFQALLGAAKYASSSGGHKRAELYAQALRGEVTEAELTARIRDKRHQDAVRALGLLPLSRGAAKGARELETRYRLLSDFRREARQWGAQKQASERLAADIGLQNLARTAGYADPQRLMWAMEARMAPDWAQTVTEAGVSVGIALSEAGNARLTVARGDKLLKALPAALKKHPGVVAIREAVKELGAAQSRMRGALEEAMVRGDLFTPQELRDLARHPVIAPMLRSLLWVLNEDVVGWWSEEALQTPAGAAPLSDHALRLAHPHDLFVGGQWPNFQQDIMTRGVAQPFKQAFREYYPLTSAEQGARRTARYDGHHVQPGKAAALFKARGWVAIPEEGVRKTWHAEGLSVWVDTSVGYGTPNEVEGAPLHAAYFLRPGSSEPLLLAEVPPRVFSETMRDLDLVVSVAHVGGVDPEASQSTTEMRAALLRETLRLLKLGNVRLESDHALIEGHHARYTVHLGSGTVHRQPGGFLCIVPVHNGHQGRLFLPFADPDPKTAEVVSKVLLLAEDRKIQDPTILEQLR